MNGFRKFMAGRYGTDQFNLFLIVLSLILEVVSMFVAGFAMSLIALVPLGFSFFRMFSRNIQARSAENYKFLSAVSRIRSWFQRTKDRAKDHDHRYFACPECGQKVRVPKGVGTISITCPNCHHKFRKKT